MVAIALKSTSSLLRIMLRMRLAIISIPAWIVRKTFTVLNAKIILGRGKTSIGNTYVLGDFETKKTEMRYLY